MHDAELDTSGLNCPLPVLRARKALKALPAGARLTVTATDPASVNDFHAFCETAGFTLEDWREEDGRFTFVIAKPA